MMNSLTFPTPRDARNFKKWLKFFTFPLAGDVRDVRRWLRWLFSSRVSFETGLSLPDIDRFYREEFGRLGLIVDRMLTRASKEDITLVFQGLPGGRSALVEAIDLASGQRDARFVTIETRRSWRPQRQDINESVAIIRRALDTVQGNLEYIQKELPSLEIPESLRREVATFCERFYLDVEQKRGDVDKLARMVRASRARKELIDMLQRRMMSENEELHKTVTMLQNRSTESIGATGLAVLVNESAANILRAHTAMWEAADDLKTGISRGERRRKRRIGTAR